jgi:MoaA/NifB/PqqE/SkfB family radical SAM enzyme
MLKLLIKAVSNPQKIIPFFKRKINQRKIEQDYQNKDAKCQHYPHNIFINVNSICNLKCKMCDVGQQNENSQFYKIMISDNNESLDLELLQTLINEVKSYKPKIAIVGTEPLLYQKLIDISDYIIRNNLELSITTNGLLLEKYAQDLVNIGISDLNVSIDGPSKIHDDIRGVTTSFEKAINGIKLIHSLKKQYKIVKPKIRINYTISKYNYHCLSQFIEEIPYEAINQVSFSHLNYVTDEIAEKHNTKFGKLYNVTQSCCDNANPKDVDTEVLFKQIQDINKNYPKKCNFIPELKTKVELDSFYFNPNIFVTKKKCLVPWTSVQILADGRVTPITRCFNISYGNIKEKTLQEIWNDKQIIIFRKMLQRHGAFPACSRCCGLF